MENSAKSPCIGCANASHCKGKSSARREECLSRIDLKKLMEARARAEEKFVLGLD